jgi:hypothetical protein
MPELKCKITWLDPELAKIGKKKINQVAVSLRLPFLFFFLSLVAAHQSNFFPSKFTLFEIFKQKN